MDLLRAVQPTKDEAAISDFGDPASMRAGYMATRLYGTADVVGLVEGLNYWQLKRWLEADIVTPEAQRANGKGSRRYFTVKNLVEIQVLVELYGLGLGQERMLEAMNALKDVDYFERLGFGVNVRVNDPVAMLIHQDGLQLVYPHTQAYEGVLASYRSVGAVNLVKVEQCVKERIDQKVTSAT